MVCEKKKTQMVENFQIKESEETEASLTKNIKLCVCYNLKFLHPYEFNQIDSKLREYWEPSLKKKEVLSPKSCWNEN